jgi:uroporphyrinogen-III synthase
VTGVRALVAQADLAAGDLGEALRAAGIEVVEVTAYSTSIATGPVAPGTGATDAESTPAADAVLFASGSAVRGWVAAFGRQTPPVVVVIGPSTGAVASELGLDITGIAADHSVVGLVTELEAHLA